MKEIEKLLEVKSRVYDAMHGREDLADYVSKRVIGQAIKRCEVGKMDISERRYLVNSSVGSLVDNFIRAGEYLSGRQRNLSLAS